MVALTLWEVGAFVLIASVIPPMLKNFSKPIDKFRIMCYYVILRIYLSGFPWHVLIIIHLGE